MFLATNLYEISDKQTKSQYMSLLVQPTAFSGKLTQENVVLTNGSMQSSQRKSDKAKKTPKALHCDNDNIFLVEFGASNFPLIDLKIGLQGR